MMIPETDYLDALASEEPVSLFVLGVFVGKAVPAAIQFHSQLRQRAIKIEDVWTTWILATEFKLIKAPVAQQSPELLFSIGGFSAKSAGEFTGCDSARAIFAMLA